MKLTFLIFLVAITGFSLYTPNLRKKATGDVVQAIESLKQQKQPDKVQTEELKNLQKELGLSPDKPLVEVEINAPVLNKFLKTMSAAQKTPKTLKETTDEFYLKSVSFIKTLLSDYGKNITFTAFLIAIVAFISKWIEIYKLAYLLSRLGWFFSRIAIVALSLTAISLYFTMKKNLWLDVGNGLFLAPLQILVASSLAFKIMDSNFPIWNRLFGSFILPTISGVVTSAAYFL